jgi:hypothetical protein
MSQPEVLEELSVLRSVVAERVEQLEFAERLLVDPHRAEQPRFTHPT